MPPDQDGPLDLPTEKKPEYIVSAVETALDLLMLIGDMPGHGLSELARTAGLSKARTFRMLQTLETSGFVSRSGKDAQYWLGPRSRQLGEYARQQIDLVSAIGPIVDELSERTRETAQLRVRQGLDSNCIYVCEPGRLIRYHGEVGHKLPIHIGSSKVLLAFASQRFQQAVLNAPLGRLTAGTPTDPARLTARLNEIRADGFCISRGESDADAVSVGAPVRDPTGEVVAVLIIAAPAARMPEPELQQLVRIVVETAANCEAALQMATATAIG